MLKHFKIKFRIRDNMRNIIWGFVFHDSHKSFYFFPLPYFGFEIQYGKQWYGTIDTEQQMPYVKTIDKEHLYQCLQNVLMYPNGQQLFVDHLTAKLISELPEFHRNFYEMEGPENTIAENHIGYYNDIRIYECVEDTEEPQPSFKTGYSWYDKHKESSQQSGGCCFDDDDFKALIHYYGK